MEGQRPRTLPQPGSVKLDEFGDFECPACATVAGELRQLQQIYGPRLKVTFLIFLSRCTRMRGEAALAAEAASLQGRFSERHDLLYQNQPIWSETANVQKLFDSYAKSLGLNLKHFRDDYQRKEVATRIVSDQKHSVALGVETTLRSLSTGRKVGPPFTFQRLRERIDAVMKENKLQNPKSR